MCAETIKAAARVCPCCQTRQHRLAVWGWEVAAGLVLVVFAVLFTLLCERLFSDDSSTFGREFAGHREELQVVNPAVTSSGKRPDFWLVGCVTNRGNRPWRVHDVEVQFLDAKGKLVDVHHAGVEPTFVVQPQRELAFRARLDGLASTNIGSGLLVRVQTATDGRRPPDPD
jgi:hypothetical protein